MAMNNRSLWQALGIAALVIGAAAAIGLGAYNAGVAHGIAESGRAIATAPAGAQVYIWPRPWGFGFFPFFPILFFVCLFFVLRGLLWRGPWRGGLACRYGGVAPGLDEWHRRAHGEPPASTPTAGGTTSR
jgi:hypothetical protein